MIFKDYFENFDLPTYSSHFYGLVLELEKSFFEVKCTYTLILVPLMYKIFIKNFFEDLCYKDVREIT